MTQKQKLKFNNFLIIAIGTFFLVFSIVFWGRTIFWNKRNQSLEKIIQIKNETIQELKIKNKIPNSKNIQEVLKKLEDKRVEFSPIISGMWSLETPTVNFNSFSVNENKIKVTAYTINTETIAKFIELLKRTPRVSNVFVSELFQNENKTNFDFVFDLLNQ